MKKAIKTLFYSLTDAGIGKELALKYVRNGYPEVSDREIQTILRI